MNIAEFYEAILHNLGDSLLIIKENGEIKYANGATEEHLGYAPEKLIGHSFFSLIDKKELSYLQAQLQETIHRKKTQLYLYVHLHCGDGTWRPFRLMIRNALALAVIHGFVISLVPEQSVTQQLSGQNALPDEYFSKLQGSLEQSSQASFVLNEQTQVVFANRIAHELIEDYAQRRLQEGVTLLRYLPSDEHDTFRNIFAQAQRGYWTEMRFEKKRREWLLELIPLPTAERAFGYVLARMREVSREKYLRLQLIGQQDLIDTLHKATSEAIFMVDAALQIIWFNQRAEHFVRLFFDKELKRGDLLPPYLPIDPDQEEQIRQRLYDSMQKGGYYHECHIQDVYNDWHWLQLTYTPLSNDRGTGLMVSILDITKERSSQKKLVALNQQLIEQNKELARQEANARKMNEQLRHQQEQLRQALEELSRRNFELDQFLYRVAHDIRAPLTSLKGLLHLIEQDSCPPHLQHYLVHMHESINRLDTFVHNMYTYATIEQKDLQLEPIDMEQLLTELEQELHVFFMQSGIRFNYKLMGRQQRVVLDQLRLRTLLHNILSNAVQYYDPAKQERFVKLEVQLLPRLVRLKIEDNGTGIEPSMQDKVFDMFFRGDERSKGAGLGLYIVRQIVEQLQGSVQLYSEPGKGTTLVLEIPNQTKVSV